MTFIIIDNFDAIGFYLESTSSEINHYPFIRAEIENYMMQRLNPRSEN